MLRTLRADQENLSIFPASEESGPRFFSEDRRDLYLQGSDTVTNNLPGNLISNDRTILTVGSWH